MCLRENGGTKEGMVTSAEKDKEGTIWEIVLEDVTFAMGLKEKRVYGKWIKGEGHPWKRNIMCIRKEHERRRNMCVCPRMHEF